MFEKKYILLVLILSTSFCFSQNYAPAAGQNGSTAIFKDSSIFINWVSSCKVTRGYQDISNLGLGFASVGDSSMVVGKAGQNGVVSLGDGGNALCVFPYPVSNGPGFDFAIFENGFDDYFLELATVEVSSDGIHFFAFEAHSLTDTLVQKASFDSLDAKKLNNLAGKYRGGYGTPFDLQELTGIPELDVYSVKYIRVKDVVGSLLPQYASYDAFQNKINDPWPSPFPSSGFDLDAIGVIYQNTYQSLQETVFSKALNLYPNPVKSSELLRMSSVADIKTISLATPVGNKIKLNWNQDQISLPELCAGIYYIEIITNSQHHYKKIVVEN